MLNKNYDREQQEWTITLNKYQRDNLLWLLSLVRGSYLPNTNTGDWAGEIPYLLAKEDGIDELSPEDSPNVSAEDWIKQNCPEKLGDYLAYRKIILDLFKK